MHNATGYVMAAGRETTKLELVALLANSPRTYTELVKKLKEAGEGNKKLGEENRLLKKLVENLDKELKRYRMKPYAEEGFEGKRSFDKNLIELLRKGGSHSQEELLAHLDVDPADTEMIKAVSTELEALEGYSLVEYSGRGWRWKEKS